MNPAPCDSREIDLEGWQINMSGPSYISRQKEKINTRIEVLIASAFLPTPYLLIYFLL
jgi:hypothetical protein